MRKILFKRKIWKKIGVSLLSLLVATGTLAAYFWLTFVNLPGTIVEVEFESVGITISGSLVLPEHIKGPFPAVIMLHGSSGTHTRDEIGIKTRARAYCKEGFAVLLYDKRGIGKSGGTYILQDYENLIADIKNAVDFLKLRKEIVPDAIGLSTNSQSGYFAPQLASERSDIAFIYNQVAPVVSDAEDNMYQMAIRMSQLHENPEDVEEIMKLYQDYMNFYIKSDGDYDYFNRERGELEERMAASWAKNGPRLPYWKEIHPQIATESGVHLLGYSFAYDPRTYLEKSFDTPIFYAFAEKDLLVPTDASVASLEEIMKRGEHNIKYKVWPNVGHSMVIPRLYFFSGAYPPGYLKGMTSWSRDAVDGKLNKSSR